MEHVIHEKQKVLNAFKKEHGNHVLGEVNIGQVIGGMRSMPGLLYETSKLHHLDGITYRGKDLYQVREQSPKAPGGSEPLPEAALWLLLTGEFPSASELKEFQTEIYNRGALPADAEALIKNFPKHMHPMTQLSAGILACQPSSKFAKAYNDGIHKSKYWEPTFEDALDVCARVSRIAAIIFHNCYKDVKTMPKADPALDYGANYAQMLGFTDKTFWDLMRLYIVIHADHEGGNVSAHATHLVGSTLADPYLSFSAGMNGLAGPLHGLANQECLKFLLDLQAKLGNKWTEDDIKKYVQDTLASGKVVPGYGHAVLRKTDPRFMCELAFADQYIKNDNLVSLVKACYKVIPQVLEATGKVSNPWPNVDAGSGALLMHYGLNQFDYYTVLFGVSRAFGVMAAQVWSRGLGLPIERPNSFTLEHLIKRVENDKKK